MLAVSIDTKALLDSAAVGLIGALGLTLAFGVAALALDRARSGHSAESGSEGAAASGVASIGWWALTVAGGAICIGIIVLGVWAMAQKS